MDIIPTYIKYPLNVIEKPLDSTKPLIIRLCLFIENVNQICFPVDKLY